MLEKPRLLFMRVWPPDPLKGLGFGLVKVPRGVAGIAPGICIRDALPLGFGVWIAPALPRIPPCETPGWLTAPRAPPGGCSPAPVPGRVSPAAPPPAPGCGTVPGAPPGGRNPAAPPGRVIAPGVPPGPRTPGVDPKRRATPALEYGTA